MFISFPHLFVYFLFCSRDLRALFAFGGSLELWQGWRLCKGLTEYELHRGIWDLF